LITAPHEPASVCTEIFAGHVITGFSLSITVTVNVLIVVFPEGSVAVEVTIVEPTGKNDPETGIDVIVAEQLSVAVAI
jgi:hypothetical protein